MSKWLSEIAAALDKADRSIRVFFRDDDAGWADNRLFALLDVFAEARMPLDMAVIPDALGPDLANQLLARQQRDPQKLGLHQHGYSHTNHEPPHNRKCEFGENRTLAEQKKDIVNGKQKLDDLLGNANDPIFTPPWNRCSRDTIVCLEEAGFKILSQDSSAKFASTNSLKLVPVSINWSRIIRTSEQPEMEISRQLVEKFSNNQLTGIMFHHADMEPKHLADLSQLLNLVSSHPRVQAQLIKNAAQ